MSFQPRLSLQRNTVCSAQPATDVAFIFKSPNHILDALDHVFGTRQHDAHVLTRNRAVRLADFNRRSDAALAAVTEYAKEMGARARAEREARR